MNMQWMLAILIVLLGAAVLIALYVRRVARDCARMMGQSADEEAQDSPAPPRALDDRTAACLPLILDADFAFEWDTIQKRAAALTVSWMQAVNDRNPARLSEPNDALREAVTRQTDLQKAKGRRERFEQPCVHSVVMTDTVFEAADTRAVIMQCAAQAVHYVAEGGAIVQGREDQPTQLCFQLCLRQMPDGWQFEAIERIN